MSEDERRNSDRRTPRFSWNSAYEDTFFRSLCESMQLGYKDSHSFKSGAWERAAIALRDKHNVYPERSHLINKADNARKKFRMWRGLREDPEFLYNPVTRMVTANEEAWKRHFEREPLSKALRGRPFDHEEYMEILFPDVVGSGGAPKRIMKKRRNPDGTPVAGDRTNSAGQNVIDMTLDPNLSSHTPSHPSTQPAPQAPHLPMPATSQPPAFAATQVNTAGSILTPPDEHPPNSTHAQKRNTVDNVSFRPTPSSTASARNHSIHSSFSNAALFEEGICTMAEALKMRSPPRWPEQAMEIFFRDFADEDPDLQLKIAEKALTDENKAMVFVKSTPDLRRHWVGRLRDVHMRNLGGGLGLGRVGDEAS
ncbi:Myb/SANT-like DNA-binding domain-containing protein [Pseudomassariella vexata]|uniref:Myb/SANT-like DNA-binding domain-domain-containing protein n=1 Tax=Pseudomassariella vexata TaxID=1141098 RepID=A0A1Y2EFU6_9PEZI|nr:Myb/SANT-like DNA-binding domain-containing protein [Pseudomassariella vexata]ORY70441.1 Myb/SANT-like DNA-binding domain-domain-containing protein [Pseudomassariella vexata]